ncbi:MAG TPA: sugar phosphate nucleotidyltransferase [Burkholderiaceae bacterium]|nr:sugar phosphate nucleotidyltransferase [Burkholderiaceae bacterium]
MTAVVVLAGGLGTRLRSVVPDLPKPMAPVAGRPFLEWLLDYWIGQGIDRIVLSVGYRREIIERHFGASYRGIRVDYAVEETPLGTGGGLLLAAALLSSEREFLLINGDTFFEVGLPRLREFHRGRGAAWTVALFRANEAGRYMGMEVDADMRIVSLKSGAGTPGRLANGGVYLVDTAGLAALPWRAGSRASLEDDIMPAVDAAGGALYGLEIDGRFIDIGVPADYLRAAEVLAA